MDMRLYLLQRASAALLALFVLVHLTVIVIATQDGLDGAEILSRTRGSLGWGAFYGLFVLMVALHGAIGLRTILVEWAKLGRGAATVVSWGAGLLLLALGLRAVWAVTGGLA